MKNIYNVKLQNIKEDDLELLMAWRSNPAIYKYFLKQDSPLMWEEHFKFWKKRKNRIDWLVLYKEKDQWRKVGSVYITDSTVKEPDIGIYIGEITLHKQGLGLKALSLVVSWTKNQGYKSVKARINKQNIASQKLFAKLGFNKIRSIHNNQELLYRLTL